MSFTALGTAPVFEIPPRVRVDPARRREAQPRSDGTAGMKAVHLFLKAIGG